MTQSAQETPSLLKMAGPLVISFWMRAAFTFVDTIYASRLGDDSVAAIGLAIPFEFIMIAVWVGLSTGLTSRLSKAMGGNHGEKIDQYLGVTKLCIAVVVPIFVLIGVGIYFTAHLWDLPPTVAREFQIYGTVLLAGSAVSAFWSVIPDSVVKAHQDTKTTMWAGIASNITNVVLNTVFVFVFHWGVFGIALSTVLGRFAGLFYAIGKANEHERKRKEDLKGIVHGTDETPLKNLLALAIPSSLAFILIASEALLINWILKSTHEGAAATAALAAYSIYYRVVMFFLNPVIALAVALLPYAAARVGANDKPGLILGIKQATMAALAYCFLFVTPILYFGGATIASWVTKTEQTLEFTTFSIQIVPFAVLAGAGFLLCRPVFEAMSRGRPGLIVAGIRYLVLTGPGLYIGMEVAGRLEQPRIYGVLIGLVVVGALASVVFVVWLLLALKDIDLATLDSQKMARPVIESKPEMEAKEFQVEEPKS